MSESEFPGKRFFQAVAARVESGGGNVTSSRVFSFLAAALLCISVLAAFTEDASSFTLTASTSGCTWYSNNCVRFTWSDAPGGQHVGVYLQHEENSITQTEYYITNSLSGHAFWEIRFSGLTDNTKFRFRLRVLNNNAQSSTSGWSDEITKGTPPAITPCSSQSSITLQTDCAVLETLYDDTGGDNWKTSTNWKTVSSLDQWHGITVSGGRVSEIKLYKNQLTGTIPSDISNLSGLIDLDLGINSLSGDIPDLDSLDNLKFLYLDGNNLGGTMQPVGVGSMNSLQRLHLHDNSISGTISELSGGRLLETIRLNDNKLSGTLDNLASSTLARYVEDLYLGNNNISGTIPDMSGFRLLDTLDLSGNSISGTMAELSKLAQSQILLLNLGNNNLSGVLPDLSFLAPGKRGLGALYLDGNSLSGTLPDLSSYTRLREIDLASNSFSGEIGDLGGSSGNLGVFGSLYTLDVSGNSLTGEIPVSSKLPGSLQYLQLNDNDLTGSVPDLSGLTKLRALGLWGNPDLTLTGITLPSGITRSVIDWAALWTLHYKSGGYGWKNRTNWTGVNPLGQWHGVTADSNGQVTALNLRNNNMSGNISGSIAALEKLVTLNLSCNSALNGELPLGLKDISTLTTVNICSTGMTAPTDSDFTTWKNSITFTDGSVCACPQAVSQQSSPPPVEEEEAEEQGGSVQGEGDGEDEATEEEQPVVPADGNTEAGGCALVSGEEPPGAGSGLLLCAAALLAALRLRRRLK